MWGRRWGMRVTIRSLVGAALVALAAGAPKAGAAQETVIALSLAAEGLSNQDDLVSARRLDGSSLGLGHVSVTHTDGPARHEFRIGLRSLELTSQDPFSYQVRGGALRSPPSEATVGDASYAYSRKVGSSWHVGGAAGLDVEHTEYEYGAGSAEGFLYVASVQALLERTILEGPRSLAVQVRIPLVSWVARPPFSTVDEERLQADNDFLHRLGTGETAFPGRLWLVDGRARYRQVLSGRLAWIADLRVRYARYDDPSAIRSLRYGADLGFGVRFGGGR